MYSVAITELEEQLVLSMPWTGPYADMSPGFRRLAEIMAAAQLRPPVAEALAVIYYDDPAEVPPAEAQSDLCVLVDEVMAAPEGLMANALPGGRCAVLSYKGSAEGLMAAWSWLYETWLPDSGEAPDKSRDPFEIYADAFEPDLSPALSPEAGEVLICLPLKAA